MSNLESKLSTALGAKVSIKRDIAGEISEIIIETSEKQQITIYASVYEWEIPMLKVEIK